MNMKITTQKRFIGSRNSPRFPYFGLATMYEYFFTFWKKPLYHLILCFHNPLKFFGPTVYTKAFMLFLILYPLSCILKAISVSSVILPASKPPIFFRTDVL